MAQKFVRVRLANGTEKSVPEVVAAKHGLEALDKPTHDRAGKLRPPKLRVPLGGAASATAYTGLKVAELTQLIDRRNRGRQEADWISSEGHKADLVAALEADDALSNNES